MSLHGRCGVLALLAALGPSLLAAQAAPVVAEGGGSVAESYDRRFDEVMALEPLAGRVAEVKGLVLQRDVARFTLSSGSLQLLTPVGGRTVAAVFRGAGRFELSPDSPVERQRLVRFEKTPAIDTPFTELVLFFADTTLAELERVLSFGEGRPLDAKGAIKQALEHLGHRDSRTFEPDLMSAFLNDERCDFFYAWIRRQTGGPLMFMLNPNEAEAVRLSGKVTRNIWLRGTDLISQFARRAWSGRPGFAGERVRQADVERYTIETWLPQTGIGEIGFSAAATLDIVADTSVGPWVAFQLFDQLKVDSARWESGEPAVYSRGKDSELLWVKLDRTIRPGDLRRLRLYYRGNLIDRIADFFQIKSSAVWYPRSLDGRGAAQFDLTFHTSDAYLLASVGERVDSSRAGHDVRTRWVTPGRVRNASFNLGLFQDYTVREDELPPVTVMMSEEAHKNLGGIRQRRMRERVGEEVLRSLQFFQHTYGPAPVRHFYATEIPGFHGEAFPGMVHLSWITFHNTSRDGEDEVFRAHEVAHQWWGIGVDYASYRDRWLSEGFSTFSGLWYLQTISRSNDRYFDMLRRWRSSILLREGDPGPISLGHRVFTVRNLDQNDYQTIIYWKGAWVVHMLRMLMLDLSTMNEDRFTNMMRDFYRQYEGRRASTDDFRRVVERHTGADMRWFFDQWVHSTAVPTYRWAYRVEPAGNGQFRVRLRVRQENVPDDFQMYLPVTLDLGKDRVSRVRVKVRGPLSEIELPLMPAEPKQVKFNDLEAVLAEVKGDRWD